MKYIDIEKLSDSDCFELASDSRLRIAKMCFNRGDDFMFVLQEVHPLRKFSVKSARRWLAEKSAGTASRLANKSGSGSNPGSGIVDAPSNP